MKILFVNPRFHTNQFETMRALLSRKHEVKMLVIYKGVTEDYQFLEPIVMEPSLITKIYLKLKNATQEDFTKNALLLKKFLPSFSCIYKFIMLYKPEIVIMRDRSLTSCCVSGICKLLNTKTVLYDQRACTECDSSLLKRVCTTLIFPKYRMSPVRGNIRQPICRNVFFIPFAVKIVPLHREYFKGDVINILSIGKFYEIKNFTLLIDAIAVLTKNYDIRLNIVGEVSNIYHKEYYKKITEQINALGLEAFVSLHCNVLYDEMSTHYLSNDIFILPSKKELAAVSPLEAMSYGLVTLSSDVNGTSNYIIDEVTGYSFKSENIEDLTEKLETLCNSKDLIRKMGTNAKQLVESQYTGEVIARKYEDMFIKIGLY